ncbi:MAG: alpha/beta hydrolase, partial [Acetobacteraceae bacterium]|nr:alpha/beta hydrolase [Acetobacteraceae bacterium]
MTRPLRSAFLAAALLLAPSLADARGPLEEAAYQAAFSAERLGSPAPSPQLSTEFTLAYRGAMPHAAFAVARDPVAGRSAWGWIGGRPTPEAAEAEALERCTRARGTITAECRIVARDATVVGAPPVALATGTLGPFRASPLHLRRGPEGARGVVVWGHGYGGPDRDNRDRPLPGLLSVLNDAGWDVLRFDRHPADDLLTTSLARLVAGLPALRAAGYRRVILAGNSRGGWQAIMAAADRPDLVQAVIAAA